MIPVGRNIRLIRELKNLTQEYVAEHLEISTGNYSNIENDKTDITLGKLERIAEILGVDYQMILNLNPSQVFKNGSLYSGSMNKQNNYADEDLLKQLQTKDEQIARLTAIIERSLKN